MIDIGPLANALQGVKDSVTADKSEFVVEVNEEQVACFEAEDVYSAAREVAREFEKDGNYNISFEYGPTRNCWITVHLPYGQSVVYEVGQVGF